MKRHYYLKAHLLITFCIITYLLSGCQSNSPQNAKTVKSSQNGGRIETLKNAQKSCDFKNLQKKCVENLPQGYTHLKTYNIDRTESSEEHAYIFSKNTDYIIILSDSDSINTGVHLTLTNAEKKEIVSTEGQGKHFNTISYHCKSTGKYYMTFSFDENVQHCASSVLAFKR